MEEAVRVIILTVLAVGIIWLLYKELKQERKRQELAKKNMSFLDSIKLTGLPIICFDNNGHSVNMVLDTGSNVCLINKDSLKELKYETGEIRTKVIGLKGEADVGDTVILPLTYKDWEFDFECWATDLNEMTTSLKKEYGVTVHGLLGTGFFSKYKYVIDFNEMVAYSLAKLD